MATILLMDDTATAHGTMVSGCQAGLEKQHFVCIYEGGKDRGTGAVLPSAELLGNRLYERVLTEEVDGVVLDISWGEAFDWDGFAIWREAKARGLAMDKQLVVFLTQHRSLRQLEKLATDNGFQTSQVLYKNAQGVAHAVRWFCKQFGLPYIA